MFDAVMNFNLGEDIDALRDTVPAFRSDEIAPRAAEIDASNDFRWIYGKKWVRLAACNHSARSRWR